MKAKWTQFQQPSAAVDGGPCCSYLSHSLGAPASSQAGSPSGQATRLLPLPGEAASLWPVFISCSSDSRNRTDVRGLAACTPALGRFSAEVPANSGHQECCCPPPQVRPPSASSCQAGQLARFQQGGLYRFKAPYPVTSSQRYLIPSSFFCEDLVMRRSLNLKVCLLSSLPARRTTDRVSGPGPVGPRPLLPVEVGPSCPTRHQGSLVIQAKMWAGAQGVPSQPTRQEKGLR